MPRVPPSRIRLPTHFVGAFPEPDGPGNVRVARQSVGFRTVGMSENVDHIGPAHIRRIVDVGVLEPASPELLRPAFNLVEQVFAFSETQAMRWASLNAGRLGEFSDRVTA